MQATSSKVEFSPAAYGSRITKTSNGAQESLIAGVLEQATRSSNHSHTIAWAVCSAVTEESYPELVRHTLRTSSTRFLGRLAASRALRKLGVEGTSVSRGPVGEPIWPEGISGSITHCHPWSVAVAMPSNGKATVGIDLEGIDQVDDLNISSIVGRGAERKWILSGENSHERLCMIFSAKEALYKSLYWHYQRYIDFTEVELMWLPEQSCFRAEFFPEGGRLPQSACFVHAASYSGLVFSCSLQNAESAQSLAYRIATDNQE